MNKALIQKRETILPAVAALLMIVSATVMIQGIFEIIDYLPHIETDGCILCTAYVCSIPCSLICNFVFAGAVLYYYYKNSRKLFFIMPYAYMLSVIPSLVYDFTFIVQKGFVADGEYNIIVYIITDTIILLNSIMFIQFVAGRLGRAMAWISTTLFFATALVYTSSVFVFYGSVAKTNFMGYYFCSNISNIILAVLVFNIMLIIYPDAIKNKKENNDD